MDSLCYYFHHYAHEREARRINRKCELQIDERRMEHGWGRGFFHDLDSTVDNFGAYETGKRIKLRYYN